MKARRCIARRAGLVRGFDEATSELASMWRRTGQPGLWFTAGAFSQARIYSRFIALRIDAIEKGGWGSRSEFVAIIPYECAEAHQF